MNAAWHQRTRLTCCNAHSSRTPLHLGRPSRVQRYSSSMHRAMEEDSLMIRHDDDRGGIVLMDVFWRRLCVSMI